MNRTWSRVLLGVIGLLVFARSHDVAAHDHSAAKADQKRREADSRAVARAEIPGQLAGQATCKLTLRLSDATSGQPLSGLLRITNLASGKAISLSQEIHRELNWFSVRPQVLAIVPQTKLRVESLRGLETERLIQEIDLAGKSEASIELKLKRFYDPHPFDLRSGNTHLHLMKMSYPEALNYLQVVPQSDGLDLVYLSHLRRIPDERDYISNQIVENSFAGGELQRLSQHGVLFGNGQEHRHNFGLGGEGFGHVMLLDLQRLIHPVSIGPGIMLEGTDGRPLQRGIQAARSDGATVIWCHNTFGYEDLPNWAVGLLHAQNIFDGGEHGSYKDSYYRYLNLGWRVPFSTGTDWNIYDFSRVYVPVRGPLTSSQWLQALQAGKSFITNGPFLEFSVNGRPIGDTLRLAKSSSVTIRGRALGRNDFRGLELIHNGEVIRTTACKAAAGHFAAELDLSLTIEQPGWLALRIPLDAGKNDLEKPQFAHTSPIYVELSGRHIFQTEVARQMISEMEQSLATIRDTGKFADDTERESVARVYRDGIDAIRRQIKEHETTTGK